MRKEFTAGAAAALLVLAMLALLAGCGGGSDEEDRGTVGGPNPIVSPSGIATAPAPDPTIQ